MLSPHFLNVDLDIRVQADPQALIDHWQEELTVLVNEANSDLRLLRFEWAKQYGKASECIEAFCHLVEQLPADLLLFWQGFPERVLDIGYESGTEYPALTDEFSFNLLHRVSAHFTQLKITIYPSQSDLKEDLTVAFKEMQDMRNGVSPKLSLDDVINSL